MYFKSILFFEISPIKFSIFNLFFGLSELKSHIYVHVPLLVFMTSFLNFFQLLSQVIYTDINPLIFLLEIYHLFLVFFILLDIMGTVCLNLKDFILQNFDFYLKKLIKFDLVFFCLAKISYNSKSSTSVPLRKALQIFLLKF